MPSALTISYGPVQCNKSAQAATWESSEREITNLFQWLPCRELHNVPNNLLGGVPKSTRTITTYLEGDLHSLTVVFSDFVIEPQPWIYIPTLEAPTYLFLQHIMPHSY